MKTAPLLLLSFISILLSCSGSKDHSSSRTEVIQRIIGTEEYERMMSLSTDDFDQSPDGFRLFSGNYELVSQLIPEYIEVNQLSAQESVNLHWHLGQLHAFRGKYDKAIEEMEQAKAEKSTITWTCYVDGTIAFLKKDRPKLLEAYETLKEQDNQMNIEFLEKFMKNINKSYSDAYNAEL